MNAKYKDNPIVNLTFDYAVAIVEFTDTLVERRRFVLADQILRSGCGIGANVREAQNAESMADFIHKMKIAIKEADENEYWLQICSRIKGLQFDLSLLEKLDSIEKVLNKIISTSKKKLKGN